jgi:Protein of unknown function (DUF3828)
MRELFSVEHARATAKAFLLAVPFVVASAGSAWAADPDPRTFLERIIQRLGAGHSIPAEQLYTPALARLLTQADAAGARRHEVPCMEGDPVIDCQDCSPLTHLTLTVGDPAQGKAEADARFTVASDQREMHYTLALTPHGWRIDDVRSSSIPSLRAYLAGPDCR